MDTASQDIFSKLLIEIVNPQYKILEKINLKTYNLILEQTRKMVDIQVYELFIQNVTWKEVYKQEVFNQLNK